MENKHFSHIHNLSPHQIPEGSQICCSGCKFHVSGTVYVCWHCNFFLHEQCFNASRSMQHPSHPAHPLNLVPYPTYPSNSIFCDSCKLVGSGFTYSCSLCEFDLHVHCAYNSYNNPSENHPIPNETRGFNPPISHTNPHQHANTSQNAPSQSNESSPNKPNLDPQSVASTKADDEKKTSETKHFSHEHPLQQTKLKEKDTILCSGCDDVISGPAYTCNQFPCNFNLHKSCFQLTQEIQHKAHPNHPLTLILLPPGYNGDSACNGCLRNCFGLTYNCSACEYNLHVECSSLPTAVRHLFHSGHPLSLFYNSPYKKVGEENELIFECSRCFLVAPDESWVYYCRKCDYGIHTYCMNPDF